MAPGWSLVEEKRALRRLMRAGRERVDPVERGQLIRAAVQALLSLEETCPDVLVADLGMPSMDGFELISTVRRASNQQLRDLPAAALTAYARSEDRLRALRSGFNMHLSKPIDPVALMTAVVSLSGRG